MSATEIIVLGCGNSTGVPAIGNQWGKCSPHDIKNKRLRSSIAVRNSSTTLIIDTGPDFREQINRAGIDKIDAVLYTHAHNDHINGINELRVITYKNKALTPIYADRETLDELQRLYFYLFDGGKNASIYPAVLEGRLISDFGRPMTHGGISFIPFIQDHGICMSVGYRFGNFGYSIDIKNLNDKAVKILEGIDIWIVDCAGYHDAANPVHASIPEIIALNQRIGAKQVFLSSLTLSMDYETLCSELPDGYQPAYDGLKLTISL